MSWCTGSLLNAVIYCAAESSFPRVAPPQIFMRWDKSVCRFHSAPQWFFMYFPLSVHNWNTDGDQVKQLENIGAFLSIRMSLWWRDSRNFCFTPTRCIRGFFTAMKLFSGSDSVATREDVKDQHLLDAASPMSHTSVSTTVNISMIWSTLTQFTFQL